MSRPHSPQPDLLLSPVTESPVQTIAYETVQEIASKFDVPIPKIVVGQYSNAMYDNGTIYLPIDLPPNLISRVTAHEMAHHVHVHYGVSCNVPEAETFARMFEEAWVRMKGYGYNYPVLSCPVCGFKLLLYGDSITCPSCKTVYEHPSPGILKAIGLGLIAGFGTYLLTSFLMSRPEVARRPGVFKPDVVSGLSAGLIGFAAGLVM